MLFYQASYYTLLRPIGDVGLVILTSKLNIHFYSNVMETDKLFKTVHYLCVHSEGILLQIVVWPQAFPDSF